MNLASILKRATPMPEPLYRGQWATLIFRPDLASQQEFIVGVAALIEGDSAPRLRWLPNFSKLTGLYEDCFSSHDVKGLLSGIERAVMQSTIGTFEDLDLGTPQVRINSGGYFASHNLEADLLNLLQRQANALWTETVPREETMGDEWAYGVMVSALKNIERIFVPGRSVRIGNRDIPIALDNGASYANIVSARYTTVHTIERHINNAAIHVAAAHNLGKRAAAPAIFVVLPEGQQSLDESLEKKTTSFLDQVSDMGIVQYSGRDPAALANSIYGWAAA